MIVAAMGTAHAQQSGTVYRIALVDPAIPTAEFSDATSDFPAARAFYNELHRLGYVEGKNILIERYSGEGHAAHYPDLARDHQHWNTIESVELLLQYKVAPFCERIIETPMMMTLAQGDNITSADLEAEALNAITNPNKTFASVSGVDHMSLCTNRDHLGKVGKVQAGWLKNLLTSIA